MSSNARHARSDSSKRKGREGSEEVAPRKKQLRPVANSSDEDFQLEDYGSDGNDVPRNPRGKSVRNEKDYPSVNELKKRIRDVKRLLNKTSLPADARILQERALAGYEQDLVEETARRERSQMIKKYHFVRFLDRKTATKQLNRLLRYEKEKDLDSKQKSHLKRKIHAARVNLNYTIYYPLTEKYLSLYPKSKGKASDNAGAESESEPESKEKMKQADEPKPALWSVVEKCMEEGNLDLLREGKLKIGADGKQLLASSEKPSAKTDAKKPKEENKEPTHFPKKEKHTSRDSKSNAKREKQARRDYGKERDRLQDIPAAPDANDSDGGFFDE
ncbi:uncharacterized protein N7459_008786 [Penicillium hispanicum]|uniref:uncharacterized protein n=1 Tax=Penicillium hispanicum TaxID=1080232 RepID=UPI00253FFB86|nr:uncharacterized protein N7459_008786 [Penicillium hispanicum]KAJ5574359.1 hypothetical protein N7459_008786 [Penicillium hispanicum]